MPCFHPPHLCVVKRREGTVDVCRYRLPRYGLGGVYSQLSCLGEGAVDILSIFLDNQDGVEECADESAETFSRGEG